MVEQPVISPEELASVLAKDPDAAPEHDGNTAGGSSFSLRRPIGIAPADEAAAGMRLQDYCGWLTRAIQQELDPGVEIEIKGFQQRQVRVVLESMTAPLWILAFSCDEAGGFALVLEAPCALALVELAMGGVGSYKAEPRNPTPLERRVLRGLCVTLRKRVNEAAPVDVHAAEFRIASVPSKLAAAGETVGAGLLSIKVADIEHRGFLLGTASLLRPSVDETQSLGRVGPMARRLARVPVETRPVLGAGHVSLSDLVALRPGHVLRLEAAEDQLLALRVAGESLLFGKISRRDNGAVFVAEKIRGSSSRKRKTSDE